MSLYTPCAVLYSVPCLLDADWRSPVLESEKGGGKREKERGRQLEATLSRGLYILYFTTPPFHPSRLQKGAPLNSPLLTWALFTSLGTDVDFDRKVVHCSGGAAGELEF